MEFLLAVFLLVFLSPTGVQPDTPNTHGHFETKGSDVCVWFELRDSIGQELSFIIVCKCTSAAGMKQSYSCSFKGPVEECSTYHTDSTKFYEEIAVSLKGIS